MNTMFRIPIRRFIYWLTIVQMLWGSVYMPVNAQVPPIGENAGDWLVYKKQLDGDQEGFINLLIILDTSDSMNQPESWRPYPGSYNSHVEYLWNDPIYINKIGVTNPPAPTSTAGIGDFNGENVRIGYFTYHISDAASAEQDQTVQNTYRATLKNAALADSRGNSSATIGGTTYTDLPKWLYRNYGGPMEFAYLHYNTYRWFHSSWIYFVPTSLNIGLTDIADSQYLLSTSFSKFLGANNQTDFYRASIPYRGQVGPVDLSTLSTNPQFNQHDRFDNIDYERFNACDASRYDPRQTRLTGLGTIAYGIKPSTVYAPANYGQTSKQMSGGGRDTTNVPMVGFNTGYYKGIKYVRFDPYYDSTQTRSNFINKYPGAGNFDDNNPEFWPPDNANFDYYHYRSNNMNFNPSYLNLRCYMSSLAAKTTFTLALSKYFNGTGNDYCDYEYKPEVFRDNFTATRMTDYSNPSFVGHLNWDSSSEFAMRYGMHGLPIRVLRYQLKPYAGHDNLATPSTRHLQTDFGKCANTANLATNAIGPGGYKDYLCVNDNNTALYMTWTKLRSDMGGFVYAHALYDLYANLKRPNSTGSAREDIPLADRLGIINKMLSAYGVSKFTATDTRWGTKNDGSAFTPNDTSQTMFRAYLGSRDCHDYPSASFNHCSGYSTTTYPVELATGVSGYVDYTRTTYNFCVDSQGKAMYTDDPTNYPDGCYRATTPTSFTRNYTNPEAAIGEGLINAQYYDGTSWFNGTPSVGLPATSAISPRVAFWPTGQTNNYWLKKSGEVTTNRDYTFTTSFTNKASLVGAYRSSTGAIGVGMVNIDYNSSSCTTRDPALASSSTYSAGVRIGGVLQNSDTALVTPSQTLTLNPYPSSGTWYWIGDGDIYESSHTYPLTITSPSQATAGSGGKIASGKGALIKGIHFDNNDCASIVTYKVQMGGVVKGKVRSNTYQVQDTNIDATTTIPARREWVGSSNLNSDYSDTTGIIYPNSRNGAGEDVNSFGAVEIRSNKDVIPPTFKQYQRFVDCGSPDRSSMKFVFAENRGNATSTFFYFTTPTCNNSSIWRDQSGNLYDANNDCLVQTGGTGPWTPTSSSNCAGLSAPTCNYNRPSWSVNYDAVNFYNYHSCSMFSNSSAYEGGNSSVSGRSCGLVSNGDFYVIDWSNPTNNPVSATLINQYKAFNFNAAGWSRPANLSNSYDFKSIFSLKGGYAPYRSIQNGVTISGGLLPNGDSNLCRFTEAAPKLSGINTPPGFSPVYFTGGAGNYTVYNAQQSYSCSPNIPAYYFSGINDPAFTPTPSTQYIGFSSSVTPALFGTSTTDAEADTAKNNGDVGSCSANTPRSAGHFLQRDVANAVSYPSESLVRLFEAYNVLKYGAQHYDYNSSLNASGSDGNLFPHFVHACQTQPHSSYNVTPFPTTTIGAGSKSNWDSSVDETTYIAKFDRFVAAKASIRDFLYPSQFQEDEPAVSTLKGFLDVGSSGTSVTATNTDGSAVDLYSVNYLNFVFGPKYNGSPIGRRTRYQLAQDTLADFISNTNTQVRIGLMFFNQPDSNSVTNGGYVAKKIRRLEAKICPSVDVSFAVSADGRTLTPASAVDNWFERVPTPSGAAIIPDSVRLNLVTGGTVIFPPSGGVTYLPIVMKGINDTGVITLDAPAPTTHQGNTVTVTLKNCNLANYPAMTGHRADLVNTIYKKRASSQTPLTETLYEAYLYFHGGTAKFGGYSSNPNSGLGSAEVDKDAFSDTAYTKYASPILDLTGPTAGIDYSVCANNNILLITDGYSYADTKANYQINSLPLSEGVSANLSNDTSGKFFASETATKDTATGELSPNNIINMRHFKDPLTSLPYGPKDDAISAMDTYSLFDELAYYLGNANISPTGTTGFHNVKLFTAALDIDCSPVIQNAVYRNRRGKCAEIDTGTGELGSVLANLLSGINSWVPSVNVAAVPLPATNRSSSSLDSYMGLFQPDNTRAWVGNLKKYRLAFGPVECGLDASSKPIDICITGKNVTKTYNAGNLLIKSRNVMTRPSSSSDIVLDEASTDYWSTTSPLVSNSGEGNKVTAGGVASHMTSYPASTTYTFLPSTATTNPTGDLTNSKNQVLTTNTALNVTSNFGSIDRSGAFVAMPSTESSTDVINFMLGADPRTPGIGAIRSGPHGDVMHSSPASVTYKSGSSLKSRVYYLTGFGDLVSVKDREATSTNDGSVAWRFYPTESLRRQYELMRDFNSTSSDLKIFAADGGVSTLVFDKNNDGYIDATAKDKVYLAFGLRRGGRAIYVLDVTDPDAPKLQWKLSNTDICRTDLSSGNLTCSDPVTFRNSNTAPANMFSELGFTWSTPLTGFVNTQPLLTGVNSTYSDIYNIKKKTPVVIFGGGYDPEEDQQKPDRRKISMGRALYVMDALSGLPIKIWSTHSNTATSKDGLMVDNNLPSSCKRDMTVNNNPFDYPIASPVYGMNVDYDSANTIDRLYVGDLGGQLFRFDVGDIDDPTNGTVGSSSWRGTRMGKFDGKTTTNEFNLDFSANLQSVNGRFLKQRTRKFFQPPVVASWTRRTDSGKDIIYHYIYGVTGDIEHPWEDGVQNIAFALVDPEVGLRMKCAPQAVATVGNIKNATTYNTYLLPDITLEGRVDQGSKAAFGKGDGVIDQYDIPSASDLGTLSSGSSKVSRENLSRAIDFTQTARFNSSGAPITTIGLMGWFYRMETSEKAVAGPRVINGQFTWTAFASGFRAGVCSRGTGTKYYLDAFWGHTVDTNNDGKSNNCLTQADYTNAYDNSLLNLPPGSATSLPSTAVLEAENYEAKLRTPIYPVGRHAGATSLQCDSPRPIYNTSYGLLQNDVQVVHDGKLYRVGFVPSANNRDVVYDDEGNFLGNNFTLPSSSTGSGPPVINTATGKKGLTTTATTASIAPDGSILTTGGGTYNVQSNASVSSGRMESYQRKPAQIYWFRDDLR